ncbi:hypothetical protein ACH5RR_025954 [Cinchona calisaya]|uniref:Uncharacterized protein n=1 Tax=Cinchona calisaya TaxID=153742 RepID=A0ABD2Z155_9GENT
MLGDDKVKWISWKKYLLSQEYQVGKKVSSTRLLIDEPMGKFYYLANQFCRQNCVCDTVFQPAPPPINLQFTEKLSGDAFRVILADVDTYAFFPRIKEFEPYPPWTLPYRQIHGRVVEEPIERVEGHVFGIPLPTDFFDMVPTSWYVDLLKQNMGLRYKVVENAAQVFSQVTILVQFVRPMKLNYFSYV